jgi:hypothetical protein
MFYWTVTIVLGPTQFDVLAGFTEGMNGNGIGLLVVCVKQNADYRVSAGHA